MDIPGHTRRWLQWGRVKDHAEGFFPPESRAMKVIALQWGRVKDHAEGTLEVTRPSALWALQWGRVKDHAEGGLTTIAEWPLIIASMGPREGSRGRAARQRQLSLNFHSFNGAA